MLILQMQQENYLINKTKICELMLAKVEGLIFCENGQNGLFDTEIAILKWKFFLKDLPTAILIYLFLRE